MSMLSIRLTLRFKGATLRRWVSEISDIARLRRWRKAKVVMMIHMIGRRWLGTIRIRSRGCRCVDVWRWGVNSISVADRGLASIGIRTMVLGNVWIRNWEAAESLSCCLTMIV